MAMTNSSVKILVVDDLPANVVAVKASLDLPGVEIIVAHSGAQALENLLVHEVALAIVDVQMPEMDGFELATLMRGTSKTSHIPIIFLTAGHHNAERQFAGYEAGAVDFLFKPFDPVILRHKVAVFVRLYHQRKQLEETLRMSQELMAIVSHDVRTPLSVVLLSAGFLKPESEPQRKLVGQIKSSADRIHRIVSDLLDLGRTRLGNGLGLDKADADLVARVRRVVQEVEAASSRGIELHAPSALHGRWDAARLEQVFANLLTNAVKHGTPEAPVRVEISHADGHATIAVHNQGEIPADFLPHIFEPFRTRTKQRGDGVGLGLYIVREIVLAHGGEVSVSSKKGETTFTVRLPLSLDT